MTLSKLAASGALLGLVITPVAAQAMPSVHAPRAVVMVPEKAEGWGGGGWGRGGGWGHRGRGGIDGGDVLAGVLIIGGIAAIAAAASSSARQRDAERRASAPPPQGGWDDDRGPDYAPPYRGEGPRDGGPGDSGPGVGGRQMGDAVNACAERAGQRGMVDRIDDARAETGALAGGVRVDGRLANGTSFSCAVDPQGRVQRLDWGWGDAAGPQSGPQPVRPIPREG